MFVTTAIALWMWVYSSSCRSEPVSTVMTTSACGRALNNTPSDACRPSLTWTKPVHGERLFPESDVEGEIGGTRFIAAERHKLVFDMKAAGRVGCDGLPKRLTRAHVLIERLNAGTLDRIATVVSYESRHHKRRGQLVVILIDGGCGGGIDHAIDARPLITGRSAQRKEPSLIAFLVLSDRRFRARPEQPPRDFFRREGESKLCRDRTQLFVQQRHNRRRSCLAKEIDFLVPYTPRYAL